MIGIVKKVPVVSLQSEANANYNPFPNDTTNPTDIQAIKNAFLADQDIIEALKGSDGQTGEQGPQGERGPAGDSVIVRDTDPTDAISSKVGDLYFNTTSGTLYQRSGITQSEFYAAGLQGIVLPNSIWINKGNLKGTNGVNGTRIYSFDTLLEFEENVSLTEYRIDDLFLIVENGTLYRKTSNTIPPNAANQSYYANVTVLKGENGLNGTKIYSFDTLLEFEENVSLAEYRIDDLFLVVENGTLYKKTLNTIPLNATNQAYYATVTVLKGGNGEDGLNGTKIYSFDTLLEFEENVGFTEYRIDDLFLIVENGTLYKKTSNTIPPNATNQAYYATATVLKGDKGDDGNDGLSIVNGNTGMLVDLANTYAENQLILGNDGKIYKRNSTPYDANLGYTPDWPYYYELIVDLKGAKGAKGDDGNDGLSIVNGNAGMLVDLANTYAENQLILGSDGKIYKRNSTPYDANLGYTPDWPYYYELIVDLKGAKGSKGDKGDKGDDATSFYHVMSDQPLYIPSFKNTKLIISYNALNTGGSLIYLNESNTVCEFIEIYNPNDFIVHFKTFSLNAILNQEFDIPAKSYTLIAKNGNFNYDFASIVGTLGVSNLM